jgi:hypothetical protein
VDPGRGFIHRLLVIKEGIEDLILHLYSPARLPCNFHCFGCHKGHTIPYETHPFVKETGVIGGGLRIGLTGRGMQCVGRIPVAHYIHYTRHSLGFGGIDILYDCMRMGRIEECQMQCIFDGKIFDILLLSRGKGKAFDLYNGLSDNSRAISHVPSSVPRVSPPLLC